jgi:hypothetical protein
MEISLIRKPDSSPAWQRFHHARRAGLCNALVNPGCPNRKFVTLSRRILQPESCGQDVNPLALNTFKSQKIGFCTPTYFVYQLRLDGHPNPR